MYRLEAPSDEGDPCISILPVLFDASRRSAFQMLSSQVELLCSYSQCEDNAEPDEDGYSIIPLKLFDFKAIDVRGNRFHFHEESTSELRLLPRIF